MNNKEKVKKDKLKVIRKIERGGGKKGLKKIGLEKNWFIKIKCTSDSKIMVKCKKTILITAFK